MQDQMVCPGCGTRVGKGSTHCYSCGRKLSVDQSDLDAEPVGPGPVQGSAQQPRASALSGLEDKMLGMLGETVVTPTPASRTATQVDSARLPALEETEFDDLQADAEIDQMLEEEDSESLPSETASDVLPSLDSELEVEDREEPVRPKPISAPPTSGNDKKTVSTPEDTSLTWEYPVVREIESSDVKEGNPFQEVAPPKVTTEGPRVAAEEPTPRISPEKREVSTKAAVAHLFPEGRGFTSRDFIDSVVGKPTKIGTAIPMPELETPSCPKCGAAITRDEFDYPPYVYDAMGRARLDYGMLKLKDNEHENAIESFEMAKRLFEKAGNAKMVEESTRRADEGYDAIAESHIVQGERHLKSGEFEWAVVQFKKAREFYMFSTDAKKRARCAERIRECYSGWGRELEAEGDSLAKSGQSRDALAKYKEAAEKFREGEDPKKLAGLERKIRKA